MITKLIFFDIDDTLCRAGILSAQNHETLKKLHRETQVKIAIATGRGSVMIPEDIQLLIREGLVDAVIYTNGQYNICNNQLISDYPIQRTDARELAKRCRQFGLPYQQLSENHIAWSHPLERYDMISKVFPDVCVVDPDYYEKHTIYQFSVFLTEDEEHAHEEYAQSFNELGFHFTRWQKGGADLLPNGASKARGIDDICRHLNVSIENTMAFGDGLNDMEMLKHVDIGVAMGDGWPQLKAIADYVTGTIEENGIENALKHFNIL